MWGLSALVIGALFGWMTPGLQNRDRVLATGLILGALAAAVFILLGAAIGSDPLPVGEGAWGTLASFTVMTVLFLFGVWIGDVLQRYQTTTN